MRNPIASPPPPDLLELLQDPRLDGMEEEFAGFEEGGRTLPAPIARASELSRFLELEHCFDPGPNSRTKWVNREQFAWTGGWGRGFDKPTEVPYIEQYKKRPRRLPHFWHFNDWFVASPRIVDLFANRDPRGIETQPIEWVFNDGSKLDGYVFLDVVNLVHGVDYRRSHVHIHFRRGRGRSLRALGSPYMLRADLPANLAYYRDAYHPSRVMVSRELAHQIDAIVKEEEIRFRDPHGALYWKDAEKRDGGLGDAIAAALGNDNEENTDQGKAEDNVLATPPVTESSLEAGQDIPALIAKKVLPMLDAGLFAQADTRLTTILSEMDAPFGPAAECAITNSPVDVATYIDEFIAAAHKEDRLAVLYIEMNAFTANTGRWFFDIFAFSFDDGRDNFGWLGDFYASTTESLTITGLEPLQCAFEKMDRTSKNAQTAGYVAEILVIARLQRLIAEAVVHCKALTVPLLASAHDYGDFIVQVATGTRR